MECHPKPIDELTPSFFKMVFYCTTKQLSVDLLHHMWSYCVAIFDVWMTIKYSQWVVDLRNNMKIQDVKDTAALAKIPTCNGTTTYPAW